MKPKDLLAHLEKGDRTMEHLAEKPSLRSTTLQQAIENMRWVASNTTGAVLNVNMPHNQMWRGGVQQSLTTGAVTGQLGNSIQGGLRNDY